MVKPGPNVLVVSFSTGVFAFSAAGVLVVGPVVVPSEVAVCVVDSVGVAVGVDVSVDDAIPERDSVYGMPDSPERAAST